jgi:hypothetical protein
MDLITRITSAASAEHTTGQPSQRQRLLGSRAMISDQLNPTAMAAIKVGDQHKFCISLIFDENEVNSKHMV